MRTSQTIKRVGKGCLSVAIVVASATQKYGLSFAKKAPEMMFGGAQNLAEQFAPSGIKTQIGKKIYEAGIDIAGDVMKLNIKALRSLKESIH